MMMNRRHHTNGLITYIALWTSHQVRLVIVPHRLIGMFASSSYYSKRMHKKGSMCLIVERTDTISTTRLQIQS